MSEIFNILKMLGEIQRELGRNSALGEATHENTMKTNGRVTKLEDFIVKQVAFNAEQLKYNSKIDGLYASIWKQMEDKFKEQDSNTKREIDEFKKLFSPSDIQVKKELVNAEGRWKVWAILATGIISLLAIVLGYYFKS